MNEHGEEPEQQDNASFGPTALEPEDSQRQADAGHRRSHRVHEGAHETADRDHEQEARRPRSFLAQEVEDVLCEHKASCGEARVDDAVEHRVDVGAAHDDDDDDADSLECLLHEGCNKRCGQGAGRIKVAEIVGKIRTQGGIENAGG